MVHVIRLFMGSMYLQSKGYTFFVGIRRKVFCSFQNIPGSCSAKRNTVKNAAYTNTKEESACRTMGWRGEKNMLFSEFRCKDVINIRDCKKLGRVSDLEFDPCNGCICKIIISRGSKMVNFLRCESDIVIPFKDIRQIGPDIILVDINC